MITILDYLEQTTDRFPERIICEDSGGETSYRSFTSRAKAIGSCLCRYRTTRRPIAIFMQNNADAWEAMMGAAYSGNFYVMIDPLMPLERIKNILETLQPIAMIVDEKCRPQSERLDFAPVLTFDEAVSTETDEAVLRHVRGGMVDTDPLYAMFTSGSTGTPKGMVVSHDTVIKYTTWYIGAFHIDEDTIFGNQTAFHFSISVSTMFSTLMTGARLVVMPKQLFSFPVELIGFMNEKKINTIYWVASALTAVSNRKALDKLSLPYLKVIMSAGEVFPTKHYNYWKKHMPEDVLFANLYGPSEAADTVTFYVIDREFRDDEPLPIGRPCANCALMVLKEGDVPVEGDEEGELCVRGSFLASGYYNDPERTRDAFVQNPLNPSFPEVMYRTGDIVRYDQYGELMYVARKDLQIKHLGYRVELGEIEAAVNAIEAVQECVCIYDTEEQVLVLYCSGEGLTPRSILQGVRDRLPKYMLPGKIFFLDELPHNANGKIDRKRIGQMYAER